MRSSCGLRKSNQLVHYSELRDNQLIFEQYGRVSFRNTRITLINMEFSWFERCMHSPARPGVIGNSSEGPSGAPHESSIL